MHLRNCDQEGKLTVSIDQEAGVYVMRGGRHSSSANSAPEGARSYCGAPVYTGLAPATGRTARAKARPLVPGQRQEGKEARTQPIRLSLYLDLQEISY